MISHTIKSNIEAYMAISNANFRVGKKITSFFHGVALPISHHVQENNGTFLVNMSNISR